MNSKASLIPAGAYGRTVLVLQGGGALGAYQAGAYQALHGQDIAIDWVAGISIGAINAAIIAGNPPADRLTSLERFWGTITHDFNLLLPAVGGRHARFLRNQSSALTSLVWGVYGFFRPRVPPPMFHQRGSDEAVSFYDTSSLRSTLERFIDFDRINDGGMRVSLGATNVRTGNFAYFDNTQRELRVEHVMASAALPPGLPAVKVDGECYWDGGIVSNTPLHYVLDEELDGDTLIFQVDLFSARGNVPEDIFEVEERHKDIVYSSRTRLNTDIFRDKLKLKRAVIALRDRLPEELKRDPEVRELCKVAEGDDTEITIVHLIYKRKHYESQSKDYEFSQLSMQEHWEAGYQDTLASIHRPDWRTASKNGKGLHIFDMQEYAQ
jgi:NTE family protein